MELSSTDKTRIAGGAIGVIIGVIAYLKLPGNTGALIAGLVIALSLFFGIIWPYIKKKLPGGFVDLDLTYLLQHMLCVSTGKPPRHVLFDVVSREDLYPKYTRIFRKIYILGKEWGYSFPDACKLVSRDVKNKILREFLVRLGAVLAVGEDVEIFLKTEYSTILNEYETHYGRVVDATKIFLGIYTSLLAASVFMLANFLLLAFFFGGSGRMVIMSYTMVTATVGSVAVLLLLVMPMEVFENKLKPKPKIYSIMDLLAIIGFIGSATVYTIIFMKYGTSYTTLGFALILSGVMFLPAGIIAKIMEGRIRDIDDFFPIFIRSYGLHLEAVPQLAKALKPLLATELGKLNKLLENAYSRLVNNIDPQVAWKLFAAESRSELVRRALRIFIDTVERGGRVAEVGALLSDHHNSIVILRRTRMQVSKTFETTTYILQMSIVMITVFITSLMQGFSSILASVQTQIPSDLIGFMFSTNLPLELIVYATAFFIIMTSIFNALSMTRASPGVSRSFWYYIGLLSILSGLGVIVGEQLMNFILKSTLESLNQTLISP